MIEMKLKKIMTLVKSPDPSKRFEGLERLFDYKQDEKVEVQIEVLIDMVKLAAEPFPEPVDSWDMPSFYLIDFVCDFPMKEVVQAILKHFPFLHPQAKARAIEFLLSTEDEGIFYELEDQINAQIKKENLILPVPELASYPMLVKGILDKNLELFQTEHYRYMFYDLLLALNASGLETSYQREYILPLLFADYEKIKQAYLPYNEDYKREFVYQAWTESYFQVRSRMRMLLNLMEFYFTADAERELYEALSYKDPMVRTEAILVLIEKNRSVDNALLEEAANDIESAEMLYWELKGKNKEHLYPVKGGKQRLLAKTRLFHEVVNFPTEDNEPPKYPTSIEVIDCIETQNAYGQPIRYYLMSFVVTSVSYAGWVGGFALEDGDDTAEMWDGTYTDFVEFHSAPIEEHKQKFFEDREEGKKEFNNLVHYESHRRMSKGIWFFYALTISQWIRAFIDGLELEHFYVAIAATLIAIAGTFIERRLNQTNKMAIIGQELLIVKNKKEHRIPLVTIKKVEYNRKSVIITDKNNELTGEFPLAWIHYNQFYYYMKEQTVHLKEVPYVQEP
jgi:hypothetical protein